MSSLKTPVSENDHIQGSHNAPITLVEYGDFECPFCGQAYQEIKKLQTHFGDSLSLVFHHFPLTEMHPQAFIAAQTSEFSAEHSLFWKMYDMLYMNQEQLVDLGKEFLFNTTESLGLSVTDLQNALSHKKYDDKIKQDFLSGVRSGVNGTPSFYINGDRYNGSFEFEEFSLAIQNKLKTLT